jgi:hypothetical protein
LALAMPSAVRALLSPSYIGFTTSAWPVSWSHCRFAPTVVTQVLGEVDEEVLLEQRTVRPGIDGELP